MRRSLSIVPSAHLGGSREALFSRWRLRGRAQGFLQRSAWRTSHMYWPVQPLDVKSSVNFNLLGYVENLTFVGSGNSGGVGNSPSNILIGNDGNNSFRGRGGADILDGGGGNDILRGNEDADTLIDLGGGNTVLVESQIAADPTSKAVSFGSCFSPTPQNSRHCPG